MEELKYLKKVITNPDIVKLETPISHLVDREFNIMSKVNKCLEVFGGYSDDCEFWVNRKFSEAMKKLTQKIKRNKNSSEFICIDVL